MLPKGTAIVENFGEKEVVCNSGSYHYRLKKGDRTPPLGMSIINSFLLRHSFLKIVEAASDVISGPVSIDDLEKRFEASESQKKPRSKKGDK